MLRELQDYGQLPDGTRSLAATIDDYLAARAGRPLECCTRTRAVDIPHVETPTLQDW
jgi:hypothetical protein